MSFLFTKDGECHIPLFMILYYQLHAEHIYLFHFCHVTKKIHCSERLLPTLVRYVKTKLISVLWIQA